MTNLSDHRIMLDSVNWQAILAAVKAKKTFRGLPVSLVAGYLDGPVSQWPAEAWKELELAGLTGRSLVGITVTGNVSHQNGAALRARAGDSEPGDMNPASAAMWASRELRLSTDYGLWVATLDGGFADLDGSDLRTQPGVVAVQYEAAAAAGGDYDVSLVVSSAWRAAKPAPAPDVPAPPSWKAAALAETEVLLRRATALEALLKAHQ